MAQVTHCPTHRPVTFRRLRHQSLPTPAAFQILTSILAGFLDPLAALAHTPTAFQILTSILAGFLDPLAALALLLASVPELPCVLVSLAFMIHRSDTTSLWLEQISHLRSPSPRFIPCHTAHITESPSYSFFFSQLIGSGVTLTGVRAHAPRQTTPLQHHHWPPGDIYKLWLVAPLTEIAAEDRVCESVTCNKPIPRGSLYYPVATIDASSPARKMCPDCFQKCLRRPGTAVREKPHDQPPDPREIQAAIRASRSKSTVNPPAVVPIAPGHGAGMSRMNPPLAKFNPPVAVPIAQGAGVSRTNPPFAQPHQSRGLMLPPSLPQPPSRTGPRVHVPSAWSAADPPGHVVNNSISLPRPSHSGYSKHHASYSAENARWSGSALGRLAETISLSISAFHEGGARKGRLPGTAFGNIVEGKKGVDAHIGAHELVTIAHETLVPLIIAFCPEFPWRPDEFVVRDDAWVDLGNHRETAETCQGYFYRECLHLKGKNYVFRTHQFPLYVVVPQSQWAEYQQFLVQRDGPATTEQSFATTHKSKTRTRVTNSKPLAGTSRHRSTPQACRDSLPGPSVTQRVSSLSRSVSPSEPLFFNEDSDGQGQVSGPIVKVTAVSSSISLKRAHMRSGSAASITTKSPPTKKALVDVIVKEEPFSPDRDGLREALRAGGAADLDTSQFLKNAVYQIDFYPIPTVSIKLILKSPNHHKFDLDSKRGVTILHPGQLRLGSEGDSFVGAGAFKTAYTATLVLSKPTTTGIGSRSHETIVIKRPYSRRPDQFPTGPFKRLPVKEESEKLFREANVLYWAKALFKLTEDFVAKRLAKAHEPPPFAIPSIRFVDAGLAFRYPANPVRGSKAPTVDCTYLCEEEIQDADTAFIKFIHNGNCVPLLRPGEMGYEVAQFLAFTQHVQYVKTKGSAYVSDYQGTISLLTDPQILTHPDIGHDLFCEGNLEKAVELFEGEHICNDFCKWPGFKLSPFGGKGKGKASDPVIVSSDSE